MQNQKRATTVAATKNNSTNEMELLNVRNARHKQNEAIEGLRGDMLRIVNENRQVQPQLAQVGGAGVPSPSQTEVRKLEDVSQSSNQAAVVQSAQGERMSVRSMGSDDTRSQSRGNALVGPCSQYELGGPGIPQVMTGGMPLGIPPGVYFMPEVAPTQQYMTTESQMIPGGCPRVFPRVSTVCQ